MLGAVENDIPDVNDHWFSCDRWRAKGARHAWGRLVKCLGLNAFPSNASPPPPAAYFSHSLAVSFPSRAFLETPATQAK